MQQRCKNFDSKKIALQKKINEFELLIYDILELVRLKEVVQEVKREDIIILRRRLGGVLG